MKKIIIILIMLVSVTLFGLGKRMIGYSIENFNGYQENLNWTHEQVDRMAAIWEDEGGPVMNYRDTNCWVSDLVDSSYTGSTESYTDGGREMVVISSHGGVSGTSATNLWAASWMYPYNGYYYNNIGNKMYFERNTEYLVLFTCFSVHDFIKDNNDDYVSPSLQNGSVYEQWRQILKKDSTPNSTQESDPKTNLLKMVFGFAGLSTDSPETDENGEDFLEDMYDESAKQAWFTGNEDSGSWPWSNDDIDDRSGVITWGDYNGVYDSNNGLDASKRRDNLMLDTIDQPHHDTIAIAYQHHNG